MKRTLDEMWAPQVSVADSSSSSSLPTPSPSATFAEHALVVRDLMEDVSVQFIEGGVVQAQLDVQLVDSVSSSEDEERTPLAPPHVLPSPPSFSAQLLLILLPGQALAAALPASSLRRERASQLPRDRAPRPAVSTRKPNQKISATVRADMLRKMHSLDPNDAAQRQRIYAMPKEDRVYCGFCATSIKNKTDNIERHFSLSDSHFNNVFTIRRIAQTEGATLDRVVVPAAPAPRALDPKTVSARLNYVRHTLRAGIPINAMDQMREFNVAHYDFSLARMSDMADAAIRNILLEERDLVIKEIKAAGFFVLVFDGTTHYGEASFFVSRYRFQGDVKAKCLAVKHADRSMDGTTLCRLLKHVLQLASIDITQASRDGRADLPLFFFFSILLFSLS